MRLPKYKWIITGMINVTLVEELGVGRKTVKKDENSEILDDIICVLSTQWNRGVVALVDRGAVYARVSINKRDLVYLIDTRAAVSMIGEGQCKRLKPCTLSVHSIGFWECLTVS